MATPAPLASLVHIASRSAVRVLETLCVFPPAQPAVVRVGGARVLVAQLASEDEALRRYPMPRTSK